MPLIIRAQDKDSTNDIIKKFKKASIMADIVQIVKDRRYYQKPSKIKAVRKIEKNRLRKRARSMKKMKNISPQVIARIQERLST